MIFGFGFDVTNVENKLQIAISKNIKVGNRIKREKDEFQSHLDLIFHPTHDFIINSNTNYFILGGGIKIRYEWDDTSKFKDEHKETYMNLLKESQADLSIAFDESKYKHGEGFMEHEVFHANN